MPLKLQIESGIWYIYASTEKELADFIEELLPDYGDVWCELIPRCEERVGDYAGSGIYSVQRFVTNPADHGVTFTKVTSGELRIKIATITVFLEQVQAYTKEAKTGGSADGNDPNSG